MARPKKIRLVQEMSILLACGLLFNQPALSQQHGQYKINAAQSTFIVHARKSGLLKFLGHDHTIAVRHFSGEILLPPGGGIASAAVFVRVEPDSLQITDDVSAEDRKKILSEMHDKVLDSDRYPEIAFRSTSVTEHSEGPEKNVRDLTVTGDLTLHGVTRTLTFETRVSFEPGRLRATGNFSLRQKDYQIKRASAAAGTVKVKDRLDFTFEILAEIEQRPE